MLRLWISSLSSDDIQVWNSGDCRNWTGNRCGDPASCNSCVPFLPFFPFWAPAECNQVDNSCNRLLFLLNQQDSSGLWFCSGSKNGYQRDMGFKQIRARAQSMIILPGLISHHKNCGDLYEHEHCDFRIFRIRDLHELQKSWRKWLQTSVRWIC